MEPSFEESRDESSHILARIRRRPLSERRILFFASFFSIGAIVFVFWTGQMNRQFGLAFGGRFTRAPETGVNVRDQSAPLSGAGELPGPLATLRENISFLRSEVTELTRGLSNIPAPEEEGSASEGAFPGDSGFALPAGETFESPAVKTAGFDRGEGEPLEEKQVEEKQKIAETTVTGAVNPAAAGADSRDAGDVGGKTVLLPLLEEVDPAKEIAMRPSFVSRASVPQREEDMSVHNRFASLFSTNVMILQRETAYALRRVRTVLVSAAPERPGFGKIAGGIKISLPKISFGSVGGRAGEVLKMNMALVGDGMRSFWEYITR